MTETPSTISLGSVFTQLMVTPGQASTILHSLANDFRDADPALATAFLECASAVTSPDPQSTKSTSTRTTTISSKAD